MPAARQAHMFACVPMVWCRYGITMAPYRAHGQVSCVYVCQIVYCASQTNAHSVALTCNCRQAVHVTKRVVAHKMAMILVISTIVSTAMDFARQYAVRREVHIYCTCAHTHIFSAHMYIAANVRTRPATGAATISLQQYHKTVRNVHVQRRHAGECEHIRNTCTV
jgi:hypothetical protein